MGVGWWGVVVGCGAQKARLDKKVFASAIQDPFVSKFCSKSYMYVYVPRWKWYEGVGLVDVNYVHELYIPYCGLRFVVIQRLDVFCCNEISIKIDVAHILQHDDVIGWKQFPRYWPFVRGIHRSPVTSPHKGQWRGDFMFSLNWAWINGWVNNGEAGDLRRHRSHYDVTVMDLEVPIRFPMRLWRNPERIG